MRPSASRSFFTMAWRRSYCAARTAASSGPAAAAPEAKRATTRSPRPAPRAPDPNGESNLIRIILAPEGRSAPGGAHPQGVAGDRDHLVRHEHEEERGQHEGRRRPHAEGEHEPRARGDVDLVQHVEDGAGQARSLAA